MSKTSLTDRFVAAAKSPDAAQTDYFDVLCPGLAVRVTSAGRKTWTFTFTAPSDEKRARMSLGSYPVLSLSDARTKAVECRRKLSIGVDPRVDDKPKEMMMEELIEDRLRLEVREARDENGKLLRKGLKTAGAIERRFNKDVMPHVKGLAVKDFKMVHLNRIIDALIDRGAVVGACHQFKDMTALFSFAVRRGVMEYSPIAKARPPKNNPPRSRTLTKEEITRVWCGSPGVLSLSLHTPMIIRLALATGQRLGEICGMRREEFGYIDLPGVVHGPEARIWTIPGERVKNGHQHIVPLNRIARALVDEAMRETNGDFLFPNEKGDGPIDPRVIGHGIRKAQSRFGIPQWTMHDLRRTMATQMSSQLEIDSFVISHILNHRGVTKDSITNSVYNHDSFFKPKRAAMDKWGEHLAGLVGIAGDDAASILMAAE